MTQNPTSAPEELRIRHQFVGMLFALTIGQIAIYSYELWPIPDPGDRRWAALAHLVLCTLLVTASWVGWSLSEAPGMRQHVQSVFSWQFIVLLIDVQIVVLYFIMVRKVEIGDSVLGGKYIAEPSAREEAIWMIWVFVAYAAWAIVANVLVVICRSGCSSSGGEWSKTLTRLPGWIAEKIFASFVCFLLTIVACFTTATRVHGAWAVVSTDAALIVLVFLFRAMKPLEKVLRHRPKGTSRRERYRKAADKHWELVCVVPFLLLFALFLILAHWLEPGVG